MNFNEPDNATIINSNGVVTSTSTLGTSMNTISLALSDASYIDYAYQTALGRSADAAGKAYWLGELQAGRIDRATLLNNFLASPESQVNTAAGSPATSTSIDPVTLSDVSYVDYAYQTVLGRSADAAGHAYWLDELQSGHIDRATLLTDFSTSAEGLEHAAALIGGNAAPLSDDDYVEYAYQTVLGRSGDAAGHAYWLDELQSGHIDRATLLTDFSASAEGLEHAAALIGGNAAPLSDDDYVEYAYQTVLGRSGDAAGHAYWLDELQSGHVDRAMLMNGFSASAEGQAHLAGVQAPVACSSLLF